MSCSHNGFRGFQSAYDRHRGVLVYFWLCERCGTRLGEATRTDYRPSYDRDANTRFFASLERA